MADHMVSVIILSGTLSDASIYSEESFKNQTSLRLWDTTYWYFRTYDELRRV